MAQPKSKTSRSKRGMRRSHISVKVGSDSICPTTGEMHASHKAFKASDGAVYFKGQQIVPPKD